MIKINEYTAKYDNSSQVKIKFCQGMTIRISELADDRELDGFMRAAKREGYALSWVAWLPRAMMNEYVLVQEES